MIYVLRLLHVKSVLVDISWQLMDYLAHSVGMMCLAVLSALLLLHAQSVFLDIT